jgi:hypothetical protein
LGHPGVGGGHFGARLINEKKNAKQKQEKIAKKRWAMARRTWIRTAGFDDRWSSEMEQASYQLNSLRRLELC